MKYNIIGYLIGEGFSNIFKQKKSTAASLIIMCATMFIFGMFFAIGQNVNNIMKQIESKQGIQVFVNKEATEDDIRQIGDKIRRIDGINKIEFESAEDALNNVKSQLKDQQALIAGWDEQNPFSASYIITLTDLEKSTAVQNEIMNYDNIKKIQSNDKTTEMLQGIASGIQIASGVILVLLVLISVFIIANTIKLTVHARRREIAIMKYVGATNNFIRWPFIVEGIIIGVISAIFSIVILGLVYNVVIDKMMTSSVFQMLGVSLLSFSEMLSIVITVYLTLGIGIGILGSTISMRRYLKV